MSQVHITDTILRDAHQSVIATRMRTEDMLPICAELDKIGYWSLEAWGGATFDACVRFLKEDPWQRLRQLREALPNTRLQMLLRGQNLLGYRHYSDDVVDEFVARAADNGMEVFRVFDALNDLRNLTTAVKAVKHSGKHAQGTICYTTSPVHDLEHFTRDACVLQEMGCDSVAIKDMAGLLTPARTYELVKALTEVLEIPVHLHSHATAGLSEMCHYKAIEAGCRHIDTAISAFSGGTSHPATESLIAALRDTPYDTGLDLEAVQKIGFYFYEVRKKYHQYESEFTGLDTRVQVNQVPGGMISNLANQLREQGALDRINEVFDEIPAVRADLGYPPLVTPTSQIVGTQAVMNVLTGERYKSVTRETQLMLQGMYGKAPGKVNQTLLKQVLGDEPVHDCRPADLLKPELDRLRKEAGDLAESAEDVMTFAMFPDVGGEFLQQRRDGSLVAEPLLARGVEEGQGAAPTEFNITLHGESFHVDLRGTGHKVQSQRPFYLNVDGIMEEVLVEALNEIPTGGGVAEHSPELGSHRPRPESDGDVITSMPAVVVEVLVEVGQSVQAGDPVLVTEAMKMETELQASIDGTVQEIYAAKGDSVNPDETLVRISVE